MFHCIVDQPQIGPKFLVGYSFFDHSLHVLLVPAVHVFVILDRWLWPKKSSLPRQFRGRDAAVTASFYGKSNLEILGLTTKISFVIFPMDLVGIATTSCWQLLKLDGFHSNGFSRDVEAKVEDRPKSSQQAAFGKMSIILFWDFFLADLLDHVFAS